MIGFRTLIVAAVSLACMAAQAQWQWIDKDGRKVFSDRGPPADVPARNILKQPGKAAQVVAPAAAPETAPSAATPASAAAGTGTLELSAQDKELDEKKKKAEAERAAAAKTEVERLASARASNCARAKEGQAQMDSGVRVSITNAQGEREILDDAGRAAQAQRIRAAIDANCK